MTKSHKKTFVPTVLSDKKADSFSLSLHACLPIRSASSQFMREKVVTEKKIATCKALDLSKLDKSFLLTDSHQ